MKQSSDLKLSNLFKLMAFQYFFLIAYKKKKNIIDTVLLELLCVN